MTTLKLSAEFKKRVTNTFGEIGRNWLKNIPNQLLEIKERFNIKIGTTFSHQSFNFTTNATKSDGTPIVVKLCLPHEDVNNEIYALEFMLGDGIVTLIKSDNKKGILLLEKLEPGEMLSTLRNDDEATVIAAGIMQKLWKPTSGDNIQQTTQQWFTGLDSKLTLPNGFSKSLIDKAKKIALELHQDMGEAVLLHGDLHHFNIISAERQPWLAIDPKGVIGEREYEVGALLRNPIPSIVTTMDTKKIVNRRIDLLTELLKFDRKKIRLWGFAQAILAAVWSLESQADEWRLFLHCAKILE